MSAAMRIGRRFKVGYVTALACTAALVLGGCGSTKPDVYQHEEFNSAGTYSHDFTTSGQAACEAARRALLSQGYVISQADAKLVKGSKSFQPKSDSHVEIAFYVVCVNQPDGRKAASDATASAASSTMFVNALQDRYALKKVNNSASLGVGVFGSVSVPFTGSDDSMVKVASETIPAGKFYDRFFALIERYIVLDQEPGAASDPAPQGAPILNPPAASDKP